ncbi:hypothetical protein [Paenibacillus senegalimassiliensis]|uniref:hypothetical protein n=1 Tax=Paenibacillus senegalimassiliensis TaxID=1737426 RepID=UPI00073F70D0|nr:hypothetical protein [Paenibacillus senegalimassiliensis]
MDNLWLNKYQAERSGKPCLLPRQIQTDHGWVWEGKWTGGPEPVCDILLTFTRCRVLGCPVGPREAPAAYLYKQSEPTQFRYIPFWARFIEQINLSQATELEKAVLARRRGDGVRPIGGR